MLPFSRNNFFTEITNITGMIGRSKKVKNGTKKTRVKYLNETK